MKVDAHQHYWLLERGDYGWLTPAEGDLYRDYLPAQLTPLRKEVGVDKTVVVQAAPTVEETKFLLSIAEAESSIAGVVGWLDLDSQNFIQEFEALSQNPYFVGIRPMLQDIPDVNWVLQPRVVEHLQYLADRRFPVDLLVFPKHLPVILQLFERVPRLVAVVDHVAKPDIFHHVLDPWREHMAQVAQHPQVMCKLSGMVTEADVKSWQEGDLRPYVEHVTQVFGPNRVMYGSDWPVCTVAASYREVFETLEQLLPTSWTDEERAAVFGENAIRFYGLRVAR